MSKPNPFAAPVPPPPVPRVRWGIAPSGPPLNAAEVETAQRAAEVTISWGDEVLHVAHVSPPRDVYVGESGDYLIGRELLGCDRLPVLVERNGGLCCVIPDGATGDVTIGETKQTFAELASEGKLTTYDELAGARMYALPDGASARMEHRGFSFLVRPTLAGKTIGASGVRVRHTGWIGLSLGVHALFLIMFYFMPPHSSALSLDNVTARDRIIEYLVETPAVVEQPEVTTARTENDTPGGTGTRAAEPEGTAGDPNERRTRNRYAIQGDPNDPNPEMARERAEENAQRVGAIGVLTQMVGTWNVPTSPYGADQAHGNDPMNALGAIMGDQFGGNFGNYGLGMRGTGRGAGGFGLGTIGLGRFNTIGHGGGQGDGDDYGNGAGQFNARRGPDGPRIRLLETTVMGGLSRDEIRRVVRRHLPEVRFCYEQGLQQNPSLSGRVAVHWIVSPDGHVQTSSVASSSLSNARVESCIAGAVERWTFPQPENGSPVGVNYPFMLESNN